MDQVAKGGANTPAATVLEAAAEALKNAAGWLTQAAAQIEAVRGDSDGAELLAEEVRDVLTRVKAEREKLTSMAPGAQ